MKKQLACRIRILLCHDDLCTVKRLRLQQWLKNIVNKYQAKMLLLLKKNNLTKPGSRSTFKQFPGSYQIFNNLTTTLAKKITLQKILTYVGGSDKEMNLCLPEIGWTIPNHKNTVGNSNSATTCIIQWR